MFICHSKNMYQMAKKKNKIYKNRECSENIEKYLTHYENKNSIREFKFVMIC